MTEMVLLSEWMSSQVEFWKPVVGYRGYDVSNFGRVRSWRSQFGKKAGTPQILSPRISRAGYLNIQMFEDKTHKRVIRFVHRLVGEAFLLRGKDDTVVNHLTALRTDARLDGLEWTTHGGNMRHAFRIGLFDREKNRLALAKAKASQRKTRAVSDDLVRTIRNMAADDVPHSKIRQWTGMSGNQVEHIIYRRRYKDVA